MSQGSSSSSPRLRNLALAAIAAQAGCVTIGIITVSLLAGLWLDAQVGRRGLFTIGLLVCSVPFTLWVMVRIVLASVRRIQPELRRDEQTNEEGEL